MAGTREGGLKAAQKNKEKWGEDYYAQIGRKGGQNGHTGGFYQNRKLASEAGKIGGKRSRRGSAKKKDGAARNPIWDEAANRFID